MIPESVFSEAIEFAEALFRKDSSGHDIYHTIRVHDLSVRICECEGGDMDTVRLASILHDVDDRKLFGSKELSNARGFLREHRIDSCISDKVLMIIPQISFKGRDSKVPDSLEGKIVQDADRLDAIGAIGIARAFAYGGSKGRAIYIPEDHFKEDMDEEEYYSNEGSSLNHFYEKLLLLKDMMNTETAKKIAEERHAYMSGFVNEFLSEWKGER